MKTRDELRDLVLSWAQGQDLDEYARSMRLRDKEQYLESMIATLDLLQRLITTEGKFSTDAFFHIYYHQAWQVYKAMAIGGVSQARAEAIYMDFARLGASALADAYRVGEDDAEMPPKVLH